MLEDNPSHQKQSLQFGVSNLRALLLLGVFCVTWALFIMTEHALEFGTNGQELLLTLQERFMSQSMMLVVIALLFAAWVDSKKDFLAKYVFLDYLIFLGVGLLLFGKIGIAIMLWPFVQSCKYILLARHFGLRCVAVITNPSEFRTRKNPFEWPKDLPIYLPFCAFMLTSFLAMLLFLRPENASADSFFVLLMCYVFALPTLVPLYLQYRFCYAPGTTFRNWVMRALGTMMWLLPFMIILSPLILMLYPIGVILAYVISFIMLIFAVPFGWFLARCRILHLPVVALTTAAISAYVWIIILW